MAMDLLRKVSVLPDVLRLIFIIIISVSLTNQTCQSSGFRISTFFNNYKATEISVFDGVAKDKMECASTCFGILQSRCRSFSFNKKDKLCSIYSSCLHSLTFSQNDGTRNYEAVSVQQFDCYDVKMNGQHMDGVYTIISRDDSTPMKVFCEISSYYEPGWLVIQRRTDGSQDFYKTWNDYKNGFGNMTNEFWLGNAVIHKVTTSSTYELRIDLEDFEGNKRYALYDSFSLDSEQYYFKLNLGSYSGTAGDSLSYHAGHYFSTKDVDTDNYLYICAVLRKGGWWYDNCAKCNLNGLYLHGHHDEVGVGVNWYGWRGSNYSLKTTVMKIRQKLKLFP